MKGWLRAAHPDHRRPGRPAQVPAHQGRDDPRQVRHDDRQAREDPRPGRRAPRPRSWTRTMTRSMRSETDILSRQGEWCLACLGSLPLLGGGLGRGSAARTRHAMSRKRYRRTLPPTPSLRSARGSRIAVSLHEPALQIAQTMDPRTPQADLPAEGATTGVSAPPTPGAANARGARTGRRALRACAGSSGRGGWWASSWSFGLPFWVTAGGLRRRAGGRPGRCPGSSTSLGSGRRGRHEHRHVYGSRSPPSRVLADLGR